MQYQYIDTDRRDIPKILTYRPITSTHGRQIRELKPESPIVWFRAAPRCPTLSADKPRVFGLCLMLSYFGAM